MFCCVVGLCPDNLCEAWGTAREWFLNIEAILFINSGILTSNDFCLPIQVSGGSEVSLWMKGVEAARLRKLR